MKQNLNGTWTLAFAPERGGQSDIYTSSLSDTWTRIPAVVPGNVEIDLVQAGLMPEPFYADNIHLYAPYEYYQWIYQRTFTIETPLTDELVFLHFAGIDTIADVYLNEQHLGRTENMFIDHEFDVTSVLVPGENRLTVHIHSAMNYARNHTYDMGMRGTAHRNEICWLRKAPHCFGWDIAPRLVSAGIWRDVYLESRPRTRITETYYACSSLSREGMTLQYGCRFITDADTLYGFSIHVKGLCSDGIHSFEFTQPAHFVSMNYTAQLPDPQLWWPAGYGPQPLYTVTMELLYNGSIVDSRIERIGLRTFRMERRFDHADQEFRFYVNEKTIWVKGTNWVPLDALHSRDASRLSSAMDLVVKSGCNMMRCWGGNVYEEHPFYDLCDENGILIWQDFAFGNTNYPQTADFVPVVEKEIGSFIRKVRNHPSIALWCTDNEIDYKNEGFELPSRESSYNRVAYEIIPRLIQAHDPYRILIKSSPEIPGDGGFHMFNVPEQHLWGPRAWFRDDFYKNNTARFISEYGFHGCPAPSSIRRYIPEDSVWPLDNDYWAVHSTEDVRIERSNDRNEMMRNHVRLMYGLVPDTLDEFAILSQLYQAEALKAMIERCLASSICSGLIWWNMIDCWPQISDSVVDYYFKRKIAYFYMCRCQKPVLAFIGEIQSWHHPFYISNHTLTPVSVTVCIEDGDTGTIILEGCYDVDASETAQIHQISALVSEQRLLLIHYTVDDQEYGNHFITGMPPYKPEDMLRWFEKIRKLPEAFEYEG